MTTIPSTLGESTRDYGIYARDLRCFYKRDSAKVVGKNWALGGDGERGEEDGYKEPILYPVTHDRYFTKNSVTRARGERLLSL